MNGFRIIAVTVVAIALQSIVPVAQASGSLYGGGCADDGYGTDCDDKKSQSASQSAINAGSFAAQAQALGGNADNSFMAQADAVGGVTTTTNEVVPPVVTTSEAPLPVVTVTTSEAPLPVVTVTTSEAPLPVFTVTTSEAFPVFTVTTSEAFPVFTVTTSEAPPTFTVTTSEAPPVFTTSTVPVFPVSTVTTLPVVPTEGPATMTITNGPFPEFTTPDPAATTTPCTTTIRRMPTTTPRIPRTTPCATNAPHHNGHTSWMPVLVTRHTSLMPVLTNHSAIPTRPPIVVSRRRRAVPVFTLRPERVTTTAAPMPKPVPVPMPVPRPVPMPVPMPVPVISSSIAPVTTTWSEEARCAAYDRQDWQSSQWGHCKWTLEYNCRDHGQDTGSDKTASDDGSDGYYCCCVQQMWKLMSTTTQPAFSPFGPTTAEPLVPGMTTTQGYQAECHSYMLADGCDWTLNFNCRSHGQDTGSDDTAGNDGSHGYRCCCVLELWREAGVQWTTQPPLAITTYNPQAMDNHFVLCAMSEGDTCFCQGNVYYGRKYVTGDFGMRTTFQQMLQSDYKEKEVYGQITCDNFNMGHPLPGLDKWCYCRARPTTPTTTQAPRGEASVTGSHTWSLPVPIKEGVKQFNDRDYYLTGLPSYLLAASLYQGPCHHSSGDIIRIDTHGSPMKIYILVSHQNSGSERAMMQQLLSASNGWAHISESVMRTTSFQGSGFDIFVKSASGVISLTIPGSGLDVELSVAVQAAPQEHTVTCALNEGNDCTCNGIVYYGRKFVNGDSGIRTTFSQMLQSDYKTKEVNGRIKCDNLHMGHPLPGVNKWCYCRAKVSALGAPARKPSQYTTCARSEGDTCRCNGDVYYGRKFVRGDYGDTTTFQQMLQSDFKKKEVSGQIKCDNWHMGHVLPDVYKWCYCWAKATPTQPSACTWTEWSEWSSCRCRMHQRRHRQVERGDPSQCQGSNEDSRMASESLRVCNSRECADCTWDQWGQWASCTCGGYQRRHRAVDRPAGIAGRACSGSSEDQKLGSASPCQRSECTRCKWSEWSQWSSCNCNSFVRRHRRIVKPPGDDGEPCVGPKDDEKMSWGSPRCSAGDCTPCVWGEWSQWSDCSCHGTQNRHRTVDTPAGLAGETCTGPKIEKKPGRAPTCSYCQAGSGKNFAVCANERENCMCNGVVYYGQKYQSGDRGATTTFRQMLESAHRKMEVDSSVRCDNQHMGGDPLLGTDKWCYCWGKEDYHVTTTMDPRYSNVYNVLGNGRYQHNNPYIQHDNNGGRGTIYDDLAGGAHRRRSSPHRRRWHGNFEITTSGGPDGPGTTNPMGCKFVPHEDCHMPFWHNGVLYNECTKGSQADLFTHPWCMTHAHHGHRKDCRQVCNRGVMMHKILTGIGAGVVGAAGLAGVGGMIAETIKNKQKHQHAAFRSAPSDMMMSSASAPSDTMASASAPSDAMMASASAPSDTMAAAPAPPAAPMTVPSAPAPPGQVMVSVPAPPATAAPAPAPAATVLVPPPVAAPPARRESDAAAVLPTPAAAPVAAGTAPGDMLHASTNGATRLDGQAVQPGAPSQAGGSVASSSLWHVVLVIGLVSGILVAIGLCAFVFLKQKTKRTTVATELPERPYDFGEQPAPSFIDVEGAPLLLSPMPMVGTVQADSRAPLAAAI